MVGLVCLAVLLAVADGMTCDVSKLGAVGDGTTLNTAALQAVFLNAQCSEVLVPARGVFLTGALNWTRSHATLTVEGTLRASTNSSLFPAIPEVPSYPCDRDICAPLRHSPVLLVIGASYVTVRGSGTIDGQGSEWWARFHAKQLKYGRPRLLQTMSCSNVLIANVTLKDSPFWTTHIWNSQHVEVAHVKVRSPTDSPNTDGVDPDSSDDVWVHDVDIEEGDDCIAVKSGMNEAGIRFGVPCTNIVVERTSCHGHAFAIGSEMSGGISNVTFRDNTVTQADTLAHIKTSKQRGGYVKDILYQRITGWCAEAINVGTTYQKSGNATFPAPVLSNFVFEDLKVFSGKAGSFDCSDSIPCSDIVLRRVHVTSALGWTCDSGMSNATSSDVHPSFCK